MLFSRTAVCEVARRARSRYKCRAVTDEDEKPPLVEDPNFLASLDDLDRGLGYEGPPGGERARLPRVSRPVSAVPPQRPAAAPPGPPPITPPEPVRRAASPPAGVAPAAPASSTQAPPRRPLLDLFPPTRDDNESPTALSGAAVGRRIASAPAARRPAPPAAAPPPPDSYETFYGLDDKPFAVSTDPKFFFPSVEHERAVVDLLTAIRERQPLMLLVGEPGIGKTTVCRAVLQQLDRRTISSLAAEPAASMDDLLKRFLVDVGVVSHDGVARGSDLARHDLAATFDSFLDSLAPLHASAVVVVDDAERQPAAVLAGLGRFVRAAPASMQIVLVGTRALAARLKTEAALRELNAAITLRVELGPLAGDEIGGYVMRRIAVAGARARMEFSDGALARLFALSRGVPAAVNALCDGALTLGFERSAATVDSALVNAAAARSGALPAIDLEPSSIARAALVAVLLLVLALAGGAAATWVFRDAVARTILQWERVPAPPGGPALLKPVPLEAVPPPADALDGSASADNPGTRPRI